MHFSLRTIVLHPDCCNPLTLFHSLSRERSTCMLLESATLEGGNDFSFLGIGCRDTVMVHNGRVSGSSYMQDGPVSDPLAVFDHVFSSRRGSTRRLSMGYIGFLSYESVRYFEAIDLSPDLQIPDAYFVLPEVLVRIDHRAHEVRVVFHDDTTEDVKAIEKAILDAKPAEPFMDSSISDQLNLASYRRMEQESFIRNVQVAQKKILAGEIFQVVLSQEFTFPPVDPVRVYEVLRSINPSPYMYLFRTPSLTIVGASPETLVRVEGDHLLYRPIAGTRKRTGDPERDMALVRELQRDEKERCEHQMLVDLGRNDVGRVAAIGSVEVQRAFRVETYAHVFHIVSDIVARLAEGKTSLDALRSTFPLGTVTGAPKLRAMEIIREIEQASRGVYGGAFGYIDLGGDIDFAIMLRTMLFTERGGSLRAGAGIVVDSDPVLEDQECMNKAKSCVLSVLRVLSPQTV